ncbi:MAG: hypothetical protein ACI9WU_001123 [Myxococcota bacterium]|jgi:hypothetical protein
MKWPHVDDTRRFLPAARMAGGFLVWTFVLLIPSLHLGLLAGMSTGHLVALAIPPVVLTLAAQRDSAVGLIIVFPVCLLPLLMVYPALTGPRVYGLGAFLATAGATLAYLLSVTGAAMDEAGQREVQTHPPGRTDRRARLIALHTAALGLAGAVPLCALYFHRPIRETIATSYAGYGGRATTFIGLLFFVCWLVLGVRRMAQRLAEPMLDPRGLLAEWYRFESAATDVGRIKASLGWALIVGVLASVALLAVMNTRS